MIVANKLPGCLSSTRAALLKATLPETGHVRATWRIESTVAWSEEK